VQVWCDACYRSSPLTSGSVEIAQAYFRRLGWMWRLDGRTLCPICDGRESTIPPPEG
jgi:hypothetical protein